MFWQPASSLQDDTARKLGLEVSNKHHRCKTIMILDYAMIHVQLRTSVDPWLPRGVHSTLDARRDQVNNLINVSVDFITNASFWRGYLLRAVRRLTLRWKLQILSYFYSFQSFQSIFGLYMMKQYVVKLRKLFPQFYTVFFVFDVTPW